MTVTVHPDCDDLWLGRVGPCDMRDAWSDDEIAQCIDEMDRAEFGEAIERCQDPITAAIWREMDGDRWEATQ